MPRRAEDSGIGGSSAVRREDAARPREPWRISVGRCTGTKREQVSIYTARLGNLALADAFLVIGGFRRTDDGRS